VRALCLLSKYLYSSWYVNGRKNSRSYDRSGRAKPPPLSEVPEAVVEVPLPNNDNGRITVEGVVVQGGSPPVPYIEYQQEDGSVRTKQLIPQGGRGCSPDAGDLPCADGSRDNYPNLNFGDRIRVSGTINGDQLLVTSVERL